VRTLLSHIRPHRAALLVAGVLGLLGAAAGLAQPLAAREVIEALAADEPVGRAILILSALVVGAAFVTAAHFWLLERTAQRVVLRARRSLTGRVLRLRMAEIDALSPGDLVSRATSDTTLLGEVASTGLVQSFNGVVSLIGAVVLMAVLDVPLLLVTLLVLVVIGATVGFVLPRIMRATERAQAAVGEMGSVLERAVGAIRTVKASGAEAREADALDRAATDAYREGMRNARYQAVIGTSTGLAIQVSFLAVLGVGGARVAAGSLPVGDLIAFLLYLFYLSEPISGIASGATQLQAGLAAVRRLRGVEDLAVEADDGVTAAVPADGPLVRFDEVGFRYRDEGPMVLDGVSFTIPTRGLVAIVGPSGAGKTTLFALLERFDDPTEGEIAFAGRDLRAWPRAQLRAEIAYVEQEAPSWPAACARTCSTRRRTPTTRHSRPRSPPPGSKGSSPPSRTDSTRRSARAAPRCRAASASAWRSPARSCARRSCCCSTRRRPSSTPSTRWRCARRWPEPPPSAPWSPSPTASRRSSPRTGSWCSTAAACGRSARTGSWWRATSSTASSPPPSSPPD
jgi:ABC-type multidrug transport system fused ATPase/permease subunit